MSSKANPNKSRLNRSSKLDTVDSKIPIDENQLEAAEEKLNSQLGGNISEYWIKKYENESGKYWTDFYKRNEARFFKDRHYLQRMFKEIPTDPEYYKTKRVLFECGCGVGNALLPLTEDYPLMHFVGIEIASSGINVLKQRDEYKKAESRIQLAVCNIIEDELPDFVNNVDFTTLIYVLSAVKPESFKPVLEKIYNVMKSGAYLFFRDYARYDMTQLRFRKDNRLNDNYYVRQDGTTSYFFSIEEIKELMESVGFEITVNTYQRKIVKNRKRGIEMERVFVYTTARKP